VERGRESEGGGGGRWSESDKDDRGVERGRVKERRMRTTREGEGRCEYRAEYERMISSIKEG
jgi:hypothetical protein